MVNEIVVCGDSFGCGIGIPFNDCFEKSFGGQVAEHFSVPLRVYARGGCCNYVIYLQIKQVVEDYKNKKPPFVLVTVTNPSRFSFPSDATMGYANYTLADVDYENYPPYSSNTYDKIRPTPVKQNKNPRLVSETVSNVLYYIKNKNTNLSPLFRNIQPKLNYVNIYYQSLYDEEIKHTQDNGLILLMHNLLKEAGIPHLIMTPDEDRDRFIDRKNFFYNNWGYYSQKYPDVMKSGHCTEVGHEKVAKKLIKRIQGYDS